MTCTVLELLEVLQGIAPFDTAEEWDNVGLLLGDVDAPVDTVMVALDVTQATIRNAQEMGAQVLLTHHPLMFRPIQQIRAQEHEGALLLALARSGLCHIAMHTNWDRAIGGVNDALAEVLGVSATPEDEILRRCRVQPATTLEALGILASERLHFPVRAYGEADRRIETLWLCGGAGGDVLLPAINAKVDCVLTGEIRHHEILAFLEAGVGVLEAGHGPTELPGAAALAQALQKAVDTVQYNVRVFLEKHPFFA